MYCIGIDVAVDVVGDGDFLYLRSRSVIIISTGGGVFVRGYPGPPFEIRIYTWGTRSVDQRMTCRSLCEHTL